MSQYPPRRSKAQQMELRYIDKLCSARRQRLLGQLQIRDKSTDTNNLISVVCISDTHNLRIPDIPHGYLLIHAGDLTSKGTGEELQQQLDWLNRLPHEHKIVIAGNHDLYIDQAFVTRQEANSCWSLGSGDVNWGSLIYLQDRSVTLQFEDKNKKNRPPCASSGPPTRPNSATLRSNTTASMTTGQTGSQMTHCCHPWPASLSLGYQPIRRFGWLCAFAP